ncbi:MAG: hypothetical protein ABL888_09285 [Pirellulaceae bacterium]
MALADSQSKWRSMLPAFSAPPKIHVLISAIAILAVFRLYLMGGEEIIPMSMDSENYARSTVHYLKGTAQDSIPSQRPGMPLLARGFAALGIPYALGMEFLNLMIAGAGAIAAGRILRSVVAPIATFAGIAYSPWLWNHSRMFMTEPLTAVLLLAMCVSVIPFFFAPFHRWRFGWVSLATIPSSFLVITRPEALVVLFFWIAVIFVLLLATRKRGSAPRMRIRLGWLLIPIIVTYGLVAILKNVHEERYGAAALCVTENPDFVDLMNALYSIEPEQKTRFAPVTMQTLAAACDVSPSLNAVRNKLLNPNPNNVEITKQLTGVEGEVGPMLNWHLVSAFHGSQTKLKSAATEIRQAQADNKIGKRFAFYPIDPLWQEWLPEFPQKFCRAFFFSYWRLNFHPSREFLLKSSDDVGPLSAQNFQDALLLRPTQFATVQCRIFGQTWDVPKSQFSKVRVLDDHGRELASSAIDHSGRWPNFNLTFGSERLDEFSAISLEFSQPDGKTAQMTIAFTNGQCHKFPQNATKDVKEAWGIDTSVSKPRPVWRDRLKLKITKDFGQIVNVLAIICFVAGVWRRPPLKVLNRLTWLLIFFAAFVSARCGYYTLVEVWLRWGLRRYVEPNQLTLLFAFMLFAFWLGAMLRYFLIDRRRWRAKAV